MRSAKTRAYIMQAHHSAHTTTHRLGSGGVGVPWLVPPLDVLHKGVQVEALSMPQKELLGGGGTGEVEAPSDGAKVATARADGVDDVRIGRL